MKAGQAAWAELMKASLGMVTTGLRTSEMMVASSSVIGARMTIMGEAARRPLEGDYAEIGGMVIEKAVAASRVSQALADQWSGMLIDVSRQAQHVSGVVLSGRPLGPRELSRLTEHSLAHGTRMMTRTMEAGGLALAPVHQQATANARRLG